MTTQPTSPRARTVAVFSVACVLVVFLVRRLVFSPSLIHANFHGVQLVDSILDGRWPPHRAEYGPLTFLVLRAASRLLARDFASIAATNQLFSALTLGMIAVLVYRLTNSRLAALATLVMGALNPLFGRVAASEDAHVIAVALGVASLLAFDIHATTRSRIALVVGSVALALTPFARQTMYLWPPLMFLLLLFRTELRALRAPSFWIAGVAVASALFLRFFSTLQVETDVTSLVVLPVFFKSPETIVGMLIKHPFFDLGRFAALYLPLGALGAVALIRAHRGYGFAFLFAVSAYLVLTLPCGWPSPGIEFAFRLPVATLAFVYVGIGVAEVERRSKNWAPVAAILCALSPIVLTGWRYSRSVTPVTVEWNWLERLAKTLPHSIALVDPELREPGPSYRIPMSPFAKAGVAVHLVKLEDAPKYAGAEPLYFIDGIACHAYSLGDLVDPSVRQMSDPELIDYLARTIFPALARHRIPDTVKLPTSERASCPEMSAHGVIAGPIDRVDYAPQELPFVAYASVPFELRLYRIRSAE